MPDSEMLSVLALVAMAIGVAFITLALYLYSRSVAQSIGMLFLGVSILAGGVGVYEVAHRLARMPATTEEILQHTNMN